MLHSLAYERRWSALVGLFGGGSVLPRRARTWREFGAPLLTAAAYALSVAVSLALTREPGGLASLWTAGGVLAAGMVLSRKALRLGLVVVCFGLHLLVGLYFGQEPQRAAMFASLSAAQASATAWLALRYCGVQARRLGLRSLSLLVVVAIIPPAIGASVVAAAAARLVLGTPFAPFLQGWFVTAALGMLCVLPSALLIARVGHYRDFRRSWLEWLAILSVLGAFTVAIAWEDKAPLMFVLLPAVTLAAVRLGPPGAAASALLVGLITAPMAMFSDGPHRLVDDLGLSDRLHLVQLFVATALFTGVATAAALSDQVRLRRLLAERDRTARQARARAQEAEKFSDLG